MYGIAKMPDVEATLMLAQEHNATAQWLRAYYIVGDDLRGSSIFSKLLQAAHDGKPSFPFTTGKNKYDFIDVDELARQISAAVSQQEVTGIINCCTGNPISLAERVEQYIKDNNHQQSHWIMERSPIVPTILLVYGVMPPRFTRFLRHDKSTNIWIGAGSIAMEPAQSISAISNHSLGYLSTFWSIRDTYATVALVTRKSTQDKTTMMSISAANSR